MNTIKYQWHHPSILGLGDVDPVAWVVERARALVFRAMEEGWSGPPYDPVALAALLNVHVRPSQEVLDARTVPTAGTVAIEFIRTT